MLENDINVKDFNIYVCALQLVIYFSSFSLSDSVDSCADFSRFQGLGCGVEPRWKANCQRQLGWHYQDLGLAIWKLPVDADRALERVRFFNFFLSGSVYSCDGFSKFHGPFIGMEPRWKANCQRQLGQHHQDLGLAIWRWRVDAASTGNLQTASPKSWWFRRHSRWRFVFHRDSTPQKGPWDCKKSGHESTERERETLRNELETKNVLVWVPGLTGLSS